MEYFEDLITSFLKFKVIFSVKVQNILMNFQKQYIYQIISYGLYKIIYYLSLLIVRPVRMISNDQSQQFYRKTF